MTSGSFSGHFLCSAALWCFCQVASAWIAEMFGLKPKWRRATCVLWPEEWVGLDHVPGEWWSRWGIVHIRVRRSLVNVHFGLMWYSKVRPSHDQPWYHHFFFFFFFFLEFEGCETGLKILPFADSDPRLKRTRQSESFETWTVTPSDFDRFIRRQPKCQAKSIPVQSLVNIGARLPTTPTMLRSSSTCPSPNSSVLSHFRLHHPLGPLLLMTLAIEPLLQIETLLPSPCGPSLRPPWPFNPIMRLLPSRFPILDGALAGNACASIVRMPHLSPRV